MLSKYEELLAKARASSSHQAPQPQPQSLSLPKHPEPEPSVQAKHPEPTRTTAQIIAERLAEIRAKKAAASTLATAIATELGTSPEPEPEQLPQLHSIDKYGNAITYNAEQAQAVSLISSGKSCILIGAAGTGKTTTIRGAIEILIRDNGIPPMRYTDNHKHLVTGTPGIVCVAYTRRAVNNIKRAMPAELVNNCMTIHKLLEYAPQYYETVDAKGNVVKTMRFEPSRCEHNPLPSDIRTLIIDESSMVAVELYAMIMDALSHEVQVIFVGDIQQLPPVFGAAILGYKMLELPTVELTQVYRQALESPIIRLAHRILSGTPIPQPEYPEWNLPNQLTIRDWKRSVDSEIALLTIAKYLTTLIEEGIYNPNEDAVLIPYNKACGTDELNKRIGNYLARKSGAVTYEIIAGYLKSYYSVGDKVLYDKEDAIIVDISPNPKYFGAKPQEASTTLDYWGHQIGAPASASTTKHSASLDEDMDVDAYLEALANDEDSITREASHIITLNLLDSDTMLTISSTGAVNSMIFGWALTVHKAQGSEWNKVFLFFHKSHATMVQRELLYTAVTRAKSELVILCEGDTFTKGITGQRIVGNTLLEKAEFFKGKKDNGNCTYTPSGKEL